MTLMPKSRARPSVSVVICAYSVRRWPSLVAAVESIRGQRPQAEEIVVVVDHNDDLLARALAELHDTVVIPNEERENGLSGARNTGVRRARTDVIAFLDDDAAARPGWLAALLEAFDDPHVLGAGGVALPLWERPPPGWFPEEFLWVVGASYRGLPRVRSTVRNPIGATMAFRREAFQRAGLFSQAIGRVGRTPLGCDETEFSIRVQQVVAGAKIVHVPEACVDHRVGAERATFGYFAARCWSEGLSKAVVSRVVGATPALASERTYVRRTLPSGVVSGVRAALHGDALGLARAGAIVFGLAATTAGYLWGQLAVRHAAR
jgi:glucosyl-dolichyl phosphate glucuronosyltransferase